MELQIVQICLVLTQGQSSTLMETSWSISDGNQSPGFYVMGALVVNGSSIWRIVFLP